MKKPKDGKENRKTNINFFKYVQPPQTTTRNKTHSRSLLDLQQPIRQQQTSRATHIYQQHHNSLSTPSDSLEHNPKSNSLKKFLSLFGGPGSLNNNSCRESTHLEQRSSSRGSKKQIFTCNIKNMNVNVNQVKDKEVHEIKPSLIVKKNKN